MASFRCPQCHAEVTKLKGDEPGCPCCGYGEKGTLAPYVPLQAQPVVIPYWQEYPWYVGDPPPTLDPYPRVTWDNGTGTYDVNSNKFTVRFTNGQAQA